MDQVLALRASEIKRVQVSLGHIMYSRDGCYFRPEFPEDVRRILLRIFYDLEHVQQLLSKEAEEGALESV